LGTSDGRYGLGVTVLSLLVGAILVPIAGATGGRWGASLALGLIWFAFVVLVAAWLVYRVGIDQRGPLRWCLWPGGACGLAFGGTLALGETAIVSGYPPVVLFTTPLLTLGGTGVGLAVGAAVGSAIDWLATRAR
jgi:hypothetical protein